MSSLDAVRREILNDFSPEEQRRICQELVVDASLVPPHLKVSCPFGGCTGACRSPSKRNKTWVCGSNFSHNERLDCCIAYRRLDRGLQDGQNAKDRRRR